MATYLYLFLSTCRYGNGKKKTKGEKLQRFWKKNVLVEIIRQFKETTEDRHHDVRTEEREKSMGGNREAV